MLSIAICDNDTQNCAKTHRLVDNYLQKQSGPTWNICNFSTPTALLHALQDGFSFDIYLLDTLLPGMTGIELAKEIRVLNRQAPIIFLSASADYAVDSYSVQALHYLLRPLSEVDFSDAMERALSQYMTNKNRTFPLRTKNGIEVLPILSMVYIEYQNHKLFVHLSDGSCMESISNRQSFDDLLGNLLNEPCIAKISVSYVVNFHHVKHMDSKKLLLTSGKELPLSRKIATGIKSRFSDFLFVSPQIY